MGTAAVLERAAIVLPANGELVGPGSQFDIKRNALRSEYAQIIEAASQIATVDSQESAEEAAKFGRLLQVGVKESEAFFKGIKTQIDAIKAPVLAAEKEDIGRLNVQKDRLGRQITAYNEKVERERREEERKAREEAERVAKAEQEERERIAREEQLQRAIELESSGHLEQSAAVLEEEVYVEPIYTPPVIIQAAAPAKIVGSVGRTNYSAIVENLMELVKAVAEGKAPIQALEPNMVFINAQARSFKEGFHLPGCKLDKDKKTGFRS